MKFKRIIFGIVVLYAILIALGTMGIDVSAIVASLGLCGFALGFAMRDTLGNLVAGILVRIYRHIKVGDKIKIAAFTGYIESINLRNTVLVELISDKDAKDLDSMYEVHHYIPNKMLFNTPVTVLEKTNDDD